MPNVCARLLPWFAGREDWLIDQVLLAFQIASGLHPPLPRARTQFLEHITGHPLVLPSAEGNAIYAETLRDRMRDLQPDSREFWREMWPGDPEISFDRLIALIDQTATFYWKLSKARQEAVAALSLPPPPRKRGAKRARETYFSRIMTDYFIRTCGGELDPAVVTLTDIAFDRKGEISLDMARSRRRSSAHSRKNQT